jgi:hypothetical protein
MVVATLFLSVTTACVRPSVRAPIDDVRVAVAELWEDPVDIKQRDLFRGVGGSSLTPNPDAAFEFIGPFKGLVVANLMMNNWDFYYGDT